MAKMKINGVEVEMTVQELLEYTKATAPTRWDQEIRDVAAAVQPPRIPLPLDEEARAILMGEKPGWTPEQVARHADIQASEAFIGAPPVPDLPAPPAPLMGMTDPPPTAPQPPEVKSARKADIQVQALQEMGFQSVTIAMAGWRMAAVTPKFRDITGDLSPRDCYEWFATRTSDERTYLNAVTRLADALLRVGNSLDSDGRRFTKAELKEGVAITSHMWIALWWYSKELKLTERSLLMARDRVHSYAVTHDIIAAQRRAALETRNYAVNHSVEDVVGECDRRLIVPFRALWLNTQPASTRPPTPADVAKHPRKR